MDECDDGNTEDGDGCSSKCKVEPGWRCVVIAKNKPMVCEPYLGPKIVGYELARDVSQVQLDLDDLVLFSSTFDKTTSLSFYITGPEEPYDSVFVNFTSDVKACQVYATKNLTFTFEWPEDVQLYGDGYEVSIV